MYALNGIRARENVIKSVAEKSFIKFGFLTKKRRKTLDKYFEIEYYIQALFENNALWPNSSVG